MSLDPRPVELPFDQGGHQLSRRTSMKVTYLSSGYPMFMDAHYECDFCAQRPRLSVKDGVVHAEGPCPAPEGVTTTISLAVPSGKLLVTDDLRPIYDVDDKDFASYNTHLGQAQYIEAMAAIGCAYGPVGNSCPDLYRTGPNSFVVANGAYDEETDTMSFPGATSLAGIVTDLWAYSMADFEDWKAKGGDPDKLNWCDTVVDVEPGVYHFTHHTGERSFDEDAPGPTIYAHIERIA